MNHLENDQKLFKTHKNFYQVVTCSYLTININIQDGRMHNNLVLNKGRYFVYQK